MKEIKPEERYIIDESQEINPPFIIKAFPALAYRNYQLWFAGQLTSLIGTWIQMVAMGWLVLELTNSAFWVGAISALGTIPVLIFSLFGGVIVDRYPKRKILFFAEATAMVLAFILGILTVTNVINIVQLSIISLLFGFVNAIDMPARLAFTAEIVGRKSLSSALAMNAGMFNAARVIGPGFAGILIGLIGLGSAFLINALSFVAVLVALKFIRVKPQEPKTHLHPLQSIKEGLVYAFSHESIRLLLIFAGVTAIFGWTYAVILPVVVKNIFHEGATGLGYANAVAGFGALFGTLILSAFSKKIKPTVFIIGGSWLFGLALIAFTFINTMYASLPFLFFAGLGLILQFATINATIQHLVDDSLRGRVMSIYTLMFLGMTPIGSLQIGYLAEHFGPQVAIRIGAVIVMISGCVLYLLRKKITR